MIYDTKPGKVSRQNLAKCMQQQVDALEMYKLADVQNLPRAVSLGRRWHSSTKKAFRDSVRHDPMLDTGLQEGRAVLGQRRRDINDGVGSTKDKRQCPPTCRRGLAGMRSEYQRRLRPVECRQECAAAQMVNVNDVELRVLNYVGVSSFRHIISSSC